jgi:hypothetical protein
MQLELFRLAIAERKQVICIYKGHYRELCPHVLGWKGGHPYVLAYQFAGRSSTGLPPGGEWCWIDVWQVLDARLRDGLWHTGQSQKKPESCIDRVAIEVTFKTDLSGPENSPVGLVRADQNDCRH